MVRGKITSIAAPKEGSHISLKINNGDELEELLTDGWVCSSNYGKVSSEIGLEVEAEDLKPPRYAADIFQTTIGKRVEVLVREEHVYKLTEKLGLVTDLPPSSSLRYLF